MQSGTGPRGEHIFVSTTPLFTRSEARMATFFVALASLKTNDCVRLLWAGTLKALLGDIG